MGLTPRHDTATADAAHQSAAGMRAAELTPGTTAVLVLADGVVFCGRGVGAVGRAVGEVCFNT